MTQKQAIKAYKAAAAYEKEAGHKLSVLDYERNEAESEYGRAKANLNAALVELKRALVENE